MAQWSTNGLPLCAATSNQQYPVAGPDGSGGVIAAWQDDRSGGAIYSQRINAIGVALWPTDGVALVTGTGAVAPNLVSNGAGGAIVTWQDGRNNNGDNNSDIYAQHVLASGAVDSVWANANGNADGTPVCTAI